MHKVADAVAAAVSVPLLHLADATADAVHAAGVRRVGLLGTAFTMEQDFYRAGWRTAGWTYACRTRRGGPWCTRSSTANCAWARCGRVTPAYREIIRSLVADGAEGVILGCTEIELLIGAEDSPVPVFPTARLHALAAVDAALRAPPGPDAPEG